MTTYQKYTTTVVGSYSVPRWYESLEKQVENGTLSKLDMADAQFRATQAAILDQELAGIDIITGGEMHRRTNNRHAPPNAMLNYFWEKIPGFSKETRPKPITSKDPNVFHPAAVCTGPVGDADLGLVDEFKIVSKYAKKEVKITMTGPHMLAKVAHDEYYGDISKFMQDLAKVINRNFKQLEAQGCRHIQIDEPLFAISDDKEVQSAVDAINLAFEGLKEDTFTQVHICQGNYAVGADYDGQIGHRYFDTGRYPADLICGINCHALLVEHDVVIQIRRAFREQAACRGGSGCPGPEHRVRRGHCTAYPPTQMAGAGTNLNHHLMRVEPPAAPHCFRKTACDGPSQANIGKLRKRYGKKDR